MINSAHSVIFQVLLVHEISRGDGPGQMAEPEIDYALFHSLIKNLTTLGQVKPWHISVGVYRRHNNRMDYAAVPNCTFH